MCAVLHAGWAGGRVFKGVELMAFVCVVVLSAHLVCSALGNDVPSRVGQLGICMAGAGYLRLAPLLSLPMHTCCF